MKEEDLKYKDGAGDSHKKLNPLLVPKDKVVGVTVTETQVLQQSPLPSQHLPVGDVHLDSDLVSSKFGLSNGKLIQATLFSKMN